MKSWFQTKLDERQQADMDRVMSKGMWLTFYLLMAAVFTQAIFLERPPREWVVEWVIFMVQSIYVIVQCFRIGVWSEFMPRPKKQHYLLYSVTAALLCAVIFTVGNYLHWEAGQRVWTGTVAVFGFWFLLFLTVYLIVFYSLGGLFDKRQKKLEEKLDEELSEDDEELSEDDGELSEDEEELTAEGEENESK